MMSSLSSLVKPKDGQRLEEVMQSVASQIMQQHEDGILVFDGPIVQYVINQGQAKRNQSSTRSDSKQKATTCLYCAKEFHNLQQHKLVCEGPRTKCSCGEVGHTEAACVPFREQRDRVEKNET